jgi:hypothetical protein
MSEHPSETTPCLTEERLQVLAKIIVGVRADAREGHEPGKGDDSWTYGCRAYRRTTFAFDELARTDTCFLFEELQPFGSCSWLKVALAGLACTLYVDGEPIKFFRTDAENPSARSLSRSLDTVRQGRLDYYEKELVEDIDGWRWVIAIETHADGSVMNVALFQVNSDLETRNLYFIPLATPAAVVTTLTPQVREGVDLPPPPVELELNDEATDADEAEEEKRGGETA